MHKPHSLRRAIPYVVVLALVVLAGPYLLDLFQYYYQALVFDRIYELGYWGQSAEGEGSSGHGSSEEVTREYRAFLEDLIRKEGIQSVVDAGCGDWEFSQYIDWGGADYLGIDISSVVLERTRERFARPGVRFQLGSAVDELPNADLLIVKDVLMHLPNASIEEFIRNNLRADKYRIAVLTHARADSPEGNNQDIRPGAFRPIDLSAPPFNLSGMEEHMLFDPSTTKVVEVLRLRDGPAAPRNGD